MWLHSLKVAQLLRSAACLHTNQSRSYLNHLVLSSQTRKTYTNINFLIYFLCLLQFLCEVVRENSLRIGSYKAVVKNAQSSMVYISYVHLHVNAHIMPVPRVPNLLKVLCSIVPGFITAATEKFHTSKCCNMHDIRI